MYSILYHSVVIQTPTQDKVIKFKSTPFVMVMNSDTFAGVLVWTNREDIKNLSFFFRLDNCLSLYRE